MSKKLELIRVEEEVAPAHHVWATSYTVDEHEAFAVIHAALGYSIDPHGAFLGFHRSGFRRAAQGCIPIEWRRPFCPSIEQRRVPAYHPKLILAQIGSQWRLVVSTGNLASDDFRQSRNLACCLDVNKGVGRQVQDWISSPPADHRALCLSVGNDRAVRALPAKGNRPTFEQIQSEFERCPKCQASRVRRGQFVVAAPFWSPRALKELVLAEPHRTAGFTVEAYFRNERQWNEVSVAASRGKNAIDARAVSAFYLHQGNGPARWHHKVLGWRCCERRGARGALYIGSANATVQGLFGLKGAAVNWEAGVLWTGSSGLFEHARRLARVNCSVRSLRFDQGAWATHNDDEDVLVDIEDARPEFQSRLADALSIRQRPGSVSLRRTRQSAFRAGGVQWTLHAAHLCTDAAGARLQRRRLRAKRLPVPVGRRARVEGEFKVIATRGVLKGNAPAPFFAEIDLVEFDAPPRHEADSPSSSIGAALQALVGARSPSWAKGNSRNAAPVAPKGFRPEDVRFPFRELADCRRRSAEAANRWLRRIGDGREPAFSQLPTYWSEIARTLLRGG